MDSILNRQNINSKEEKKHSKNKNCSYQLIIFMYKEKRIRQILHFEIDYLNNGTKNRNYYQSYLYFNLKILIKTAHLQFSLKRNIIVFQTTINII